MNNSSALVKTLLACEIAEVELDLNEELGLTQFPGDFVIEANLSERLTLSIEFDAESCEFLVKSSTKPSQDDLSLAITLALSLNHPAVDSDRFSLDLETSSIIFTRRLIESDMDLADLAFAVRTAIEVGIALSRAELPGILSELQMSGASLSDREGMVRG